MLRTNSKLNTAIWFALCVATALVVFARYGLWQAPLTHDMSLQMYSAQLIARGLPPYVTVGLVKTPLTGLVGAGMVLLGNAVGVWGVLAVRVGFWLIMALGVGGMFLWAHAILHSRLAALLAALTLISLDVVGRNAVLGPQPKTLVMVAAIYAFYFLARGSWFWAGLCATLAFLAWQPAAILMGIVVLMPLLDPGGERGRALGRALLGLCVPLIVVTVYLVSAGALTAAFQYTFGANLSYLQNSGQHAPLLERVVTNAAKVARRATIRCYSNPLLLAGGLAGIAALIGAPLVERKPRALWSRRILPVLLYGGLFLAFTLLDFQVCDDLMPLAPLLALGVGVLAALGLGWLAPRVPADGRLRAAGVAATLLLFFLAANGWLWLTPPTHKITLRQQLEQVAQVKPWLEPGDTIQQLGDAVLLVFLKKQNPTRLIFFGPKTGTGVLRQIPGGLETVLSKLEENPPRLIALSHVRASDWSDELLDWVETNYTPVGEYAVFGPKESMMQIYVREQ